MALVDLQRPVRSSLRGALTAVFAVATLAAAPAALGAVVTYPSSATIPATGPLPAGSGTALALNAAGGEQEAGQIVVTGAKAVSATIDPGSLGGIQARLAFAHFVNFSGRLAPDALLPWDGALRATEQANQPLYVILEIPVGTAARSYTATVTVTADSVVTRVEVALHVFPVSLPAADAAASNLLTSFHLSAGRTSTPSAGWRRSSVCRQ